jgi:hypothetical protein
MFFVTLTNNPLDLTIPGSSNANQYSNPLLFQQPQTIPLLTDSVCLRTQISNITRRIAIRTSAWSLAVMPAVILALNSLRSLIV